MKQLVFVLGLLTLSVTAATQAHADLAVVRFNGGYCRVWTYAGGAPSGLPVSGVSARLAGPPTVATYVCYGCRSRNGPA